MEGEDLHHTTATVVTVVEVVAVEFQGVLTIGVVAYLLFGSCINNLDLNFKISFLTCNNILDLAVLVTGLPSSASWQDLKVIVGFCILLCFIMVFSRHCYNTPLSC